MTTAPTRIDGDVFAAAKAAAAVSSRSAAQQINHWARIGRALESSGTVSPRDIARVLAGGASYDALNRGEQAVVRAEWDERATAVREQLDFAVEFATAGESWVEADADGRLVDRPVPTTTAKTPTRGAATSPRPRRQAS